MRSISISLVLLLVAAALPASGAAPDRPASTNAPASPKLPLRPSELFGNTVVAKGKGFEISRGQLDDEVIRVKSQAAARREEIPPDRAAVIERQVLEQLIQVQLLRVKATEADTTTGKALAEKRFEEAKTRLGSEEALNRQLKLMGVTREELLARWTESAIAETVLKSELKVNVTDAEVRKYYDDNPARFEEPETARANLLLLLTIDPKTQAALTDEQKAAKRKLMEGLLKRARGGEDFVGLVKEYSEAPGAKETSGEVRFARGQLPPELMPVEAATFPLATNQISDIVTTGFGYYLVKLFEKVPARKVEFDKAAADIKEGLTREALQKQFPDYLAKLKAEAGVEILDEKIKAQALPNPLGVSPAAPPGKSGSK